MFNTIFKANLKKQSILENDEVGDCRKVMNDKR